MAGPDKVLGDLQNRQRGQAQEVELDQAYRLDVVLVVLAHGRFAARLLVQRAEVGQLARGDQHAAGVHADVARHAFELLRQLDQGLDVLFLGDSLGQQRLHLDRVVVLVALLLGLGRVLQRHAHAGLVRNQLADAVAEGVAHVEHTAHVADRRARRHGAEGGNLADRVLAVLALDVVDHPVAVALAEVDVEVGHGHPLRVQEALEQQLVLQGVQVGDLQGVGHQRAGPGATPRADRAAVVLGPVDEVAHDQEVTREVHLQDHVDLELQPLFVARALALALCRVGVQMDQALFQPLVRGVAEIGVGAQLFAVDRRNRVFRQHGLAELEREAATPRNFQRVGQRAGKVGKQCRHLGAGFEVLLTREAPHPALVAQDLAVGDAHPCLMRLVVLCLSKLHRVRGHHRQLQACRQLHGGHHMGLVVNTPCPLQFDVEAVRKGLGQRQCHIVGTRGIALQQCRAERPGLGAGEQDQAFVQFAQPFKAAHAVRLAGVLRPGAGQQLTQVQVALAVLHQQDYARQRILGAGRGQAFDAKLGAYQRFDAGATSGLVELDGAEQVVQVGDGQCGLAVAGRSLDDVIDAVGAVDDGKLGVQAEVNVHACIVGRPHRRDHQ